MCDIAKLLKDRVLVLDGALGTEFQRLHYRCSIPEELVLFDSSAVHNVHMSYLEAGADIITTCSFNANEIDLKEHRLEGKAYEISRKAAEIAQGAAQTYSTLTPYKYRCVAGSVGPTSKLSSIPCDSSDLTKRCITFDELVASYKPQIRGLIEGGVDIILFETVDDILNLKAAIYAYKKVQKEIANRVPCWISVTPLESGRLLSGHSLRAVWNIIAYAKPLIFGLNCGFGIENLSSFIDQIDFDAYTSIHANAGLQNPDGTYPTSIEEFKRTAHYLISNKKINVIGGCCGTTPEYIKELTKIVYSLELMHVRSPRKIDVKPVGINAPYEADLVTPIKVGERCNVAGSAKFRRLLQEHKYEEAVSIAKSQIDAGAKMIDICVDHADLDGEQEMKNLMLHLTSDSKVLSVPFMIDSSNFDRLVQGIKLFPGHPVANSISLKVGELKFKEQLDELLDLGATVVIMLMDKDGQAVTLRDKQWLLSQSISTSQLKEYGELNRIIIDPNVLAICTGNDQDNFNARHFIDFIDWLNDTFPKVATIGGISNLSFAFRKVKKAREILNEIFVQEAGQYGLTYAIVNPEASPEYTKQERELAIMAIYDGKAQKFIDFAKSCVPELKDKVEVILSPEEQITKLLKEGDTPNLLKALREYAATIKEDDKIHDLINTLLTPAINDLGADFEQGKVFLPDLVKAAASMKAAVAYLDNFKTSLSTTKDKIIIATVNGDIHDIGKNIVASILSSKGYEIIDLGTMVPCNKILEAVQQNEVKAVCLSGLITPSLEEMRKVLITFNDHGIIVPIIVGGAATTKLFVATKLAPLYHGVVAKAITPTDTLNLVSNLNTNEGITILKAQQEYLRKVKKEDPELIPLEQANNYRMLNKRNPFTLIEKFYRVNPLNPVKQGFFSFKPTIEQLIPYIDWKYFFFSMRIPGKYPELLENSKAALLLRYAEHILNQIREKKLLQSEVVFSLGPAKVEGNNIITTLEGKTCVLPMLRNQTKGQPNLSVSDFFYPSGDYVGLFAVTAGTGLKELLNHTEDDFVKMLTKLIADRLTEATAEYLHDLIRTTYWGYQKERISPNYIIDSCYVGKRFCFGYPATPDHSLKKRVFDFLEVEKNSSMRLVGDNYMITPEESLCGIFTYLGDYFSVGKIGDDQLKTYSEQVQLSEERLKTLLPNNT